MTTGRAPGGFVDEVVPPHRLYVRSDLHDLFRIAGLHRPCAWEGFLRSGEAGAGRGRTVRVPLAGGVAVRLKTMLRGGMTAALWRDRFPRARLLGNLELPIEARRRGVATPAPAALLIRTEGLGLCRGWLATEEVDGAVDLLTLSRRGSLPSGALAGVLAAVRVMHDRGVHHRDLHLGNLLVRARADGDEDWEAWIIDLDRARIRPAEVPLARRLRALRRLGRSWAKHVGDLDRGLRRRWAELYAGDDPCLALQVDRALGSGAAALVAHRARWRLTGLPSGRR